MVSFSSFHLRSGEEAIAVLSINISVAYTMSLRQGELTFQGIQDEN